MYRLTKQTIIKKVERMEKTKYVKSRFDHCETLVFCNGTDVVLHNDMYRSPDFVTTDNPELEDAINRLILACRSHNKQDVKECRENFFNLTGTFPVNGDLRRLECKRELLKNYIDFAKTYHKTFDSPVALEALSRTSILAEVYYKACLCWNGSAECYEIPASRCFYCTLKKKLDRTEWDNWMKLQHWKDAIY